MLSGIFLKFGTKFKVNTFRNPFFCEHFNLSCTDSSIFILFLLDKICGEGQEDEGVWPASILSRSQTFFMCSLCPWGGGVHFTGQSVCPPLDYFNIWT